MTALEAAMATLSASSKTDTASTGKAQPNKKRKAKTAKLPVPPPKSTESVLDKGKPDPTKAPLEALTGVNEDGLDLPEYLKVENRVPLTPEQQAKLDAPKAAAEEKQNVLREQIKAAKAEKSRGRVAKMLAKKSGASAAMPLTGKAAQEAIRRVTLIRLKPENGDSKIVAEAVQNGKAVHKVPAGKTYEQVMEAERNVRRMEANKSTPVKSKPVKSSSKATEKKSVRGIGAIAKEAILAGKTNEQALAAVMNAFPDCSSNINCISWYRNDLRKKGLLKPAKK